MRDGRIEQLGTPEDVYARPASRHVARFIGSPPLDFLPGNLGEEDGRPVFRVGTAELPLPSALAARLVRAGDAVELAVRPKHVMLAADGVPATVRLVQPVGPSTFVTLAWRGGELVARFPGMARLEPAATVHFRIDDDSNLMFFDATSGRLLAMPG